MNSKLEEEYSIEFIGRDYDCYDFEIHGKIILSDINCSINFNIVDMIRYEIIYDEKFASTYKPQIKWGKWENKPDSITSQNENNLLEQLYNHISFDLYMQSVQKFCSDFNEANNVNRKLIDDELDIILNKSKK